MLAFPVRLELRRSRVILVLLVLLHALAASCALFLLPGPLTARGVVSGFVVFSLWRAMRPSSIVALHLGERGELGLSFVDGSRRSAVVRPETTVFAQFVVLRLSEDDAGRATGRVHNLTLAADSMPAGQFRLLRLWLRWRVSPDGADGPRFGAA